MSKKHYWILKISIYFILGYLVKLLFNAQGYNEGFHTDTIHHLQRIMPIVNGEYYLPHSMLHYLTYSILKLCDVLNIPTSMLEIMIWLETLLLLSIVAITHKILKFFLKDRYGDITLLLIAVALMFPISIYTPFFNEFYYLGQWGPNTWHNPTTFLIKPIALCCLTGMFLYLTEDRISKKKFFKPILILLMTLGIWAKPSFAITFYPALGLYLLLYHPKNYKLYLNTFLILLPSILLLAMQYYWTYSAQVATTSDMKDNIIFTFFGVTRHYSNSVIISLLLAIAFPLSVLILDYSKALKNRLLMLTWLTTFIAFLQSSFLAEKFKFDQAAFAFGYNLALFFLFIFSLIHLLNYIRTSHSKKETNFSSVMLFLFVIHLICGIHYYFHFLLTGDFS